MPRHVGQFGVGVNILAGLFADADPNETAAEREAKRNIITSLVTGIAAMSDPNGAATANNAATANVDNNWLATQQKVQRDKELDAAPDLIEKIKVWQKWGSIDSTQDVATGFGLIIGLQEGGWKDISGLAEFMASPLESLDGLRQIVTDKNLRAKIGDAAADSLLASIGRMEYALENGGTDQALQLGRDLGLLLQTVGGLAADIGGLAKAASALGKVGVEISSKVLGQFVGKDGAKISETVAQLEASSSSNLKSTLTTIDSGAIDVPITSKGFVPAAKTGLNFEVKVTSSADGYMNVEIAARQKFDKAGAIVDSKYAQSDLVARYSPDGAMRIDWYGTTVTGRGVGSEMVSNAIEAVGPSNVKKISAQLGETNLEVFRAAKATGLSSEQAVWKTPLGKTMSSLGFNNVEMSSMSNDVVFLP